MERVPKLPSIVALEKAPAWSVAWRGILMEPLVAVIGTVFVDCKGLAGSAYLPLGRNLGRIRFVHGGVGRNVAENLGLLNCRVYFVSTVDDSALGREVADRLGQANVKLDYLSFARDGGMGMWLAVMDQNGDLAGSISQMPDLGFLEGLIAAKGRSIMEEATHVVLELDLNEQISRQVIELARVLDKRIYGIPGNLDVVMKNRDLLFGMDCFICNDIELGRLLGISLAGLEIEQVQDILVEFTTGAGLQSMVLTLGERGSVYYDAKTGDQAYQPAFKTVVVDSSGAGDAFFSGTVAGLIRNLPLGKAVVLGTKLASLTIQSEENTCSGTLIGPDPGIEQWQG